MGFLEKLFGTTVDVGAVKLSGRATSSKDAAEALVRRHDPDGYGYLEVRGVLRREPSNTADPNAVAVLVEGERIGYLPSVIAKQLGLSARGSRTVRVQVFSAMLERGLRVEAWAWLGRGAPKWEFSDSRRPPMTSVARAKAKKTDTDQMVRSALAEGGPRAEQFRAGMVDGVHYLQLVEPIKQLKREGRLEEALALCYKAIEATENETRATKLTPPPAYTRHAAIILRKLGRPDEERAVLERYERACPPQHMDSQLLDRLWKLRATASK